MIWRRSDRCDPIAARIADRHYSRQSAGSPQFIAPGRPLVLLADVGGHEALWVTLQQPYPMHEWVPSWVCTHFRNEGAGLSSELIRDACAATRWAWGDPPEPWGMITFVDPGKVRRKRDPGRCFLRAGFVLVGQTHGRHKGRSDLLVFSLPPSSWPEPAAPGNSQVSMWGAA